MNFVDYLKMEYVKDDDGEIITRVPIEEYCLNINKIVHGGLTMTLIDTACGKKASEYFDGEFVTSDGYVNFLRPASKTSYLFAKCKAKKIGRTIANIDCDVFDDEKNLIAIGRFTFIKLWFVFIIKLFLKFVLQIINLWYNETSSIVRRRLGVLK